MIDFFIKNKKARGSISIMLTLILLPMYTAVTFMIEASRYESARSQLDELTYMGELAILSDYVYFLEDKYDLYAYDALTMEKSWEEYVKYTTTAGSIDTTHLNTLFGVDLDQCTIYSMYSLADPDVLGYQIRQYGIYSMPADILSKILLKDLLGSLSKKLKKYVKIFKLFSASMDMIDDRTSIIDSTYGICQKQYELKAVINDYYNSWTVFKQKSVEVKNRDITNIDDYEDVFEYLKSSSLVEKDSNNVDDLEKLKETLDKDSYIKAVVAYSDIYEQIYEGNPNNNSLQKKLEKCTIEVEDSDEKVLGLKGEVKVSSFLAKVGECVKTVQGKDYLSNNNYELGKKDVYEKLINDLDALVNSINDKLDKLESCQNLAAAIEAYQNMYLVIKDSDDGLAHKYEKYTDYMISFNKDMKSLCDNIHTLEATAIELSAVASSNEEDDNELDSVSYVNEIKDINDQKIKIEQNGKDNLDKTKKDKNYSKLGEYIIGEYTSNINENTINQWKTNFKNNTDSEYLPEISKNYFSDMTFEKFKSMVIKIWSCNGEDEDNAVSINFDGDHLIKEFGIMDISYVNSPAISLGDLCELVSIFNLVSNDSIVSILEKYSFKKITEKMYSPIISDSSDIIQFNQWNLTDKKAAYYLNDYTLELMMAYLCFDLLEESQLKDIFSSLKNMIELLENVSPADASLNSHIGNDSSGRGSVTFWVFGDLGDKKLSDADTIWNYPSTLSFDHDDKLQDAKSYSENKLKDKNGLYSLPVSDYYINDRSNVSQYGFLDGYQPGGYAEYAVDSMADMAELYEDIFSPDLLIVSTLSTMWKVYKSVKACANFFKYIVNLLSDIYKFVSNLINGEGNYVAYLYDEMIISYYIDKHFTSRQTTDKKNIIKFKYNPICVYSEEKYSSIWNTLKTFFLDNNGDCKVGQNCFVGAQKEYILAGNDCELSNQRNAYYTILAYRMVANIDTVLEDESTKWLADVPILGWVILLGVDYVESKMDMMFILTGYKVPLVKEKIWLTSIVDIEKGKFKDDFKNDFKKAVDDTLKTGGLGYDENTGKYTTVNSLDKYITKLTGLKKDSPTIQISGGLNFNLNYEQYLWMATILYPVDTKLKRIADLIQMEGMHYNETAYNSDTGFRLSDCYTYIYADVSAKYSPLLPVFSKQFSFAGMPMLRSVQMNGY